MSNKYDQVSERSSNKNTTNNHHTSDNHTSDNINECESDTDYSASDSSVYGCDSTQALRAVDSTLLELSRRKQAKITPNTHMKCFLTDHHSLKSTHYVTQLIDASASVNGCHDTISLRNRMRQVRFQLAIQKQLIDRDRDRVVEQAAIRELKNKEFLNSQESQRGSVVSDVRPRLQISVPQHFSAKQSRRQKSEGVTAWDGSQYMLSLLFSLLNKLLLKYCFIFIRDRAHLWHKKKIVASKMFDAKCRMLVTECFAGLKVSWLQHRHDQTAKARGRRHYTSHTHRTLILRWRHNCNQRKYFKSISEFSTFSHVDRLLRRSWRFLYTSLVTVPQLSRKQLCKRILDREISSRAELSRQREFFAIPRPRLEPPLLKQMWRSSHFGSSSEISEQYHCTRRRCRSMLSFIQRTTQLRKAHSQGDRGARHCYFHHIRGSFRLWWRCHERMRWLCWANDVIVKARQRKRLRVLRGCFQQFCAERDRELELRGVFEGLTPPPIVVHSRDPLVSKRPPLSVSFRNDKFHNDSSTLTCDDANDISIDSLNDAELFASLDENISSPIKRRNVTEKSSSPSRSKSSQNSKRLKGKASLRNTYRPTDVNNNDLVMNESTDTLDTTINHTNNNNNNNNSNNLAMNESADTLDTAANIATATKELAGVLDKSINSTVEKKNQININGIDDDDNRSFSHENRSDRVFNARSAQNANFRCKNSHRDQDGQSEISSLATNESYLPLLQGVGASTQNQLPLSYHLYTSTVESPVSDKNADSSSLAESSSDGNITLDMPMRNTQDSLPLSHKLFLQQKHSGHVSSRTNLTKEYHDSIEVDFLSSDSESSVHLRHMRRRGGQGREKGVEAGVTKRVRSPTSSLIREVDRRFRNKSLKSFVSIFYKWKRQTYSVALLRRVFSHAMTLWENRYNRSFSSLPFHLLRHIINIWKFAVSLAQQRRHEAMNLQRALMYRGISLMSRVFVEWTMWTRQMLRKRKQMVKLEHMTKQVCFLGLVMLFQKLQVKYDEARSYYKLRCKRNYFDHLFEYAVRSQETHREMKERMRVIRQRITWRNWVLEYKRKNLMSRAQAHTRRRELALTGAYWWAWFDRFKMFRRHGLFAKQMEDIFIRMKAKKMFMEWPGRELSIKATALRRKHQRDRSRLMAIVLGKAVVPFSMRNKVIPSTFIHGAFSNKYNEDNDSISITSSVSCLTRGDSDEENKVTNFSPLEPNQKCHNSKGAGGVVSLQKKMSSRSTIKGRITSAKCHMSPTVSLNPREKTKTRGDDGKKKPNRLLISTPLLLPPPPSYYQPHQYYSTTESELPSEDIYDCDKDSSTSNDDLSVPLNRLSFQKQAVELGYCDGRQESRKLVRLFMLEIVSHWRIYSKKHKETRRLGQFLQSCTKLRCISKKFYHWLVRSSALAHRQNTWILPNQKQVPYYSNSQTTRSSATYGNRRVQNSSNPSVSIGGKSNLSMGYAPPRAACRGNTLALHSIFHQQELPAPTHVHYELEVDAQSEHDDFNEDLMDPYPLRQSATISVPAVTGSTDISTRAAKPGAITGKSFIQPLVGTKVPPKPTQDQLYEIGKFYLGHRNVQYSHVVGDST